MARRRLSSLPAVYAEFRVRGVWPHGARPAIFHADEWDDVEDAALDMAHKGARVTVYERDDEDAWEPVDHVGLGRNAVWARQRNDWLKQRQEAIQQSRNAARRRLQEEAEEWRAAVAEAASLRQFATRAAGAQAAGPPGTGSKGKASRLPR